MSLSVLAATLARMIGEGVHRGGPTRLLNASWPRFPRRVRAAPKRVPVVVRLEWPDGAEWAEGNAIRWTGRHVFVAVWHERLRPLQGVWVDAGDIRRR